MSFEVTILGSSSAIPTVQRNLTAHVVNVHEQFFLIDCGEGTQMQLRRYKLKMSRIDHIFISHLHGDHFLGLFGLLSTMSLLGRDRTMHIYAHTQMEEILDFGSKFLDFSFPVKLHKIGRKAPALLFENKAVEVYSLPLDHRIATSGFKFVEKIKEPNIKKEYVRDFKIPVRDIVAIKQGADYVTQDGSVIPNHLLVNPPPKPKSYAFCSDTAYYENLIPHIKNVDLLYHEATFTETEKKRAEQTRHSTAKQAATIARKAEVGKLIIGHFSIRYKVLDTLISEARREFSNVVLARDGETHQV